MQRAKHAHWLYTGLRRVEPATGENRADGKERSGARRHAPVELGADLREIRGARILEVGANLQIAWVFRWLAVDKPRVRRRCKVVGMIGGHETVEEFAHRFGECIEADGILDDRARVVAR